MSDTLAQMVRAKHPGAYDDLSDQALEAAVTAKFPGDYDDIPRTADFKTENAKDASGKPILASAADFLGEATAGLNPVTIAKGLWAVVSDLGGTVQHLGEAQGALAQKAKASMDAGDYMSAIRHSLAYLVPILGPRLDQAGDFMQQGEIAKGLGATADVGLQVALPKMASSVTARVPAILKPNLNPVEASAVRFGQSEGIPIDAATATGSQTVKNIQKKLGGTLGGSSTVENAQAAQADALAGTGNRLAAVAGPTPATPVSAGEGIAKAIDGQIQALHTKAATHYDAIRAVEADPARAASMQMNLTAARTSLKPLYSTLSRENSLVPLQGGKGRVLVALDRIMNGPESMPLSEVDSALGDLKSMSRGADMPELRTGGQATAAAAVQQLDAQVRTAAAKAGPDVLTALQDGRAATVQKYRVADVRDLLSGEPGQVFRQLTANKDTALNKLRAVQQVAPKELENVARAYLEDVLDLATAEGGFGHADRLFANWQKLGDDTKRVLFPKAGQVQALDDFFLLAKKIKENPNPSGTATVKDALSATQLLAYLPSKALAKLLYTPTGVKALTSGLKLSMSTAPAARTAAFAQVARAAKEAGVPLPAAADQEGQRTPQ